MKLIKATKDDIKEVFEILTEFEKFNKKALRHCLENVSSSPKDWPTLDSVLQQSDNAEEAIQLISEKIASIPWLKCMLNLGTLLNNCADPNEETLALKPEIKQALDYVQRLPKSEYPPNPKL